MKQLLILSGKGGTGKTTIASAFIKLAQARAYADCDVDAPNLHLVMHHDSKPMVNDYYGLPKAIIDIDLCIGCDLCRLNCRFEAISANPDYRVEYYACEGCGVCEVTCPTRAVSLQAAVAGELMLYQEEAVFSTAQLKMGSGTSGKLVTEVKKQLNTVVSEADFAVIDGSPGIGCPVIASISGVDLVLIVAEPSLSGISDMERIVKTAQSFQTKIVVCVNKYDTNMKMTAAIKQFCQKESLPLAGLVPFDEDAVKAVNNGQTIVDIDCPSGQAVKGVYEQTMRLLFEWGHW